MDILCFVIHSTKKMFSSLMKNWNLPTFTANETFTIITWYELSQEESNLLKAGLYLLIHPDKIRKSDIFTIFEKIHYLLLNNLNFKKTKSQIKAHLSFLLILIFTTTKPLHVYYVNILSYETLQRIKILLWPNPIKEIELSF